MRISNIQNFAVNMMDKCCKPRKSVENNQAQNGLERSPAMDTVSFGKFGVNGKKGYKDEKAEEYAQYLLLAEDMSDFEVICDSIYLDVVTKDFMNNIYSASLVSLKALQPWENKDTIDICDRKIKNAYKEFNKENDLEEGWERKLHDEKDFRLLAELARHLNYNGYGLDKEPEGEGFVPFRYF